MGNITQKHGATNFNDISTDVEDDVSPTAVAPLPPMSASRMNNFHNSSNLNNMATENPKTLWIETQKVTLNINVLN